MPAANDLKRICDHIAKDNPSAAQRVARTIYEGCNRLKRFPNLGRVSTRTPGKRELIFPPLPYIVVYQIKDAVVEISRIYHGAQDWP